MMQQVLACGDSSDSVPAESLRVPALCNTVEAIWVSTDLRTWCPDDPSRIARDCQINDRCYRQLDPEYFAWLKFRMHVVNEATEEGRVPAETFDDLRQRFNNLQARAIRAFGEQELLGALRNLHLEEYRPPLPDEFEKPKPIKAVPARISSESERLNRARGLVDEIRDQALALGWTLESLYSSGGHDRRPSAAGFGLVCCIGSEVRIGEVTRQAIELIGPPPMGVKSHFYNPNVEQPWIRSRSTV